MPTDDFPLIFSDESIDELLRAIDVYICAQAPEVSLSQGGKYALEMRCIVRQWLRGKHIADCR